MTQTNKNIPVYSLDKFRSSKGMGNGFQVEVFDANRHFQVEYPHRHDFYEVLYLSKGSGFHLIDNNKYAIEPPCIFFMSPGQTHKLELSNDIDGYIFLFSADFYLLNQRNKNRLLTFPFFFSVERQNPPLYLADKEDNEFLKSLFVRGCKEIEKEVHAEEIIRSLLELILLTCNQLYPKEYGVLSYSKGHILVKNFLLLIEENYQNNMKVSDYADKLAITSNHLTQIVKQITGKTTTEILQETNIMEIKRLLIHTNLTISEIAQMMNFVDQSYFSKYFKKITGKTPLDYRKESMKST